MPGHAPARHGQPVRKLDDISAHLLARLGKVVVTSRMFPEKTAHLSALSPPKPDLPSLFPQPLATAAAEPQRTGSSDNLHGNPP